MAQYLFEHKVNGTTRVDVHKVHVDVVVEQLGTPRHRVWEAALQLKEQDPVKCVCVKCVFLCMCGAIHLCVC